MPFILVSYGEDFDVCGTVGVGGLVMSAKWCGRRDNVKKNQKQLKNTPPPKS